MKSEFNMIHPELQMAARFVLLFNKTFTLKRFKFINGMQRYFRRRPKLDGIVCEETFISRSDDSRLRLLMFKSLNDAHFKNSTQSTKQESNSRGLPCMIWFHGGGYAIGTPEQAARTAKLLIDEKPCVVIAPAYRLSIQAPYPAALEDAYLTLLWVSEHAKRLGVRQDQIFVGGESAGGGLCAALSLYARDQGNPSIAFQMPLYPMLDDRMLSASSTHNNAPVWNAHSNYNAWSLYLGSLFQTDHVPIYAAPGRAKALNLLPPTATFVGDLEPFYDEVVEYVNGLKAAGVPVDFRAFLGCYHAFEQMNPKAQVSREAVTFIKNAYHYAVDHYFAGGSYD